MRASEQAHRRADSLRPEQVAQDVADLVAVLHGEGAKRESIRKVVNALAMVLDHAGVSPNPARDKVAIKLPREEREEPNPPTDRASCSRTSSCSAFRRSPMPGGSAR